MIKSPILYFLITVLSVSVGLSQKISYDSIFQFYEQQLEVPSVNNSDLSDFSQRTEKFVKKQKLNLNDNNIFFETIELIAEGQKSKFIKANIHFIEKLLPYNQENKINQAFLLNKLGDFYSQQNQNVNALENYLRALNLLDSIEPKTHLGKVYYRISLINMEGFNTAISIKYAESGIKALNSIVSKSREDSILLMHLHGVMGVAYRRLENFDEALIHIDKALIYSTNLDQHVSIAINNGNKATIYYEKKEYDKAIPLLENDLETSIASGIYNSGMNAAIYLCWIHIEQNDTVALKETFDEMIQIKKNYPISNPRSKTEFLKLGAKVAELDDDIALANEYLKEFVKEDAIRDSINLSNDIASLHERHLMQQEISKLELLKSTNRLQASHLKLRTALLIIIALAFLIVLWYVFALRLKNKNIDRLNELLEAKVSERTTKLLELNKELDTYLYRASHDIRRPIRTLLGLNNIAKISDDSEQLVVLFSKVHETALSMDKMLFKLQMAYELNNKHPVEQVDIKELFEECKRDMALEITEKNAQINFHISDNATSVSANKALLRIALDNLLENAILYQNHEQPQIDISTDLGNYYFYIHVKDNGFGIPEDYYTEIFKPYFKISNKTQGSGLGLFLANRAISFLAGDIVVTSVINEGSQFTIKIPVNPK